MGDILKEAIADAKAVRETALQNAKMALEEAFTPQLKSMLSAKLREDDDEFEDEVPAEHDEIPGEEIPGEEIPGEEIPAEEGDYYEDDEIPGEEVPLAAQDEIPGEEVPGEEEMEEEGIIEINGIKYAPIAEQDEEVPEEEPEANLDIESIIRELESELDEQDDAYDEKASTADKNDGKTSSDLAEEDDAYDEKNAAGRDGLSEQDDDDEEVEIDESLFFEQDDDDEEEVTEQSDSSEIGKSDNKVDQADGSDEEDPGDSTEVYSESNFKNVTAQLKEYKEAVHFLKDKLHEVNILNAKLLFTNKLFKEYSLNNNQKLKVVETFDRAQSTREIKLVYSTLAEQFGDNGSITKKSIKESASSKVGSTKPSKESRKVITEEAQVAERFKKLAGII